MTQHILRKLGILALFGNGCFWAVTDSVASCDIPAFIEVGRGYDYQMGKISGIMTVAEIDKQSCWVKTNADEWINLNQLTSIKINPLKLSRTASPPGLAPPAHPSESFRDCPGCPEMVRLPTGEFMMGAAEGEVGAGKDEKPRHLLKIMAFSIGQYEVTQGLWKLVMGSNPSHFASCGDNCPVEQVSFNDVQEFIRKLNVKTGQTYRLPTEAEWEYAARAGTTTPFSTGNCMISRSANYNGVQGDNKGCGQIFISMEALVETAPVGSYPANPWGLHDIHGNVSEWTCSAYTEHYDGSEKTCTNEPKAPRGFRGGSWHDNPELLRSASRKRENREWKDSYLGFRLAMDF